MSKVLKIDEENLTITCQAGASWKAGLRRRVGERLPPWAPTPAASRQRLGGRDGYPPPASAWATTSTARPGTTSATWWSLYPDGSIVNTGFETLADNMSGYNLNRLFVGAEGTLGVICEVTFKLTPRPEAPAAPCLRLREPRQAAAPHEGHHPLPGQPPPHRLVRR